MSGIVKNLTISDSAIKGISMVGGLIAINYGSLINCSNLSNVVGTGEYIGGVVGKNSGTMEQCINQGNVATLDFYVAGVASYNEASGTIRNCVNTGDINGRDAVGIVDLNYGSVKNCYNTGDLTAFEGYVGGLASENYGSVENCFSTGLVSAPINDPLLIPNGGLLAYNLGGGTITNCYYNTDTIGERTPVLPAVGSNESSNVINPDTVTGKATSVFESGEMTYLLETGSGDTNIWGQKIGTDLMPQLTTDEVKKVYKSTLDGNYYNKKVVSVQNGSGDGNYINGETITITADPAASGMQFKNWTVTSGGITFVDAKSANTTFTMPNTAVEIVANYELIYVAPIQPSPVVNDVKLQKITLSSTTKLLKKDESFTLTAQLAPENATKKALTWTSTNPTVATVSESGIVTAKNYGTAVVTATAQDGSAVFASCQVSVGYQITYHLNKGKNNSANPLLYYGESINLKNPTRKNYVFVGWYADSKYKNALTTIKKESTQNVVVYAKWKKITVSKVSNLSLVNKKSKQLTIRYPKISGVKGYEIIYATNNKFSKAKKKVLSTTSNVVKGLKKGKTYYVKVRAYKKDSAGNLVYGKYSKTISVKLSK